MRRPVSLGAALLLATALLSAATPARAAGDAAKSDQAKVYAAWVKAVKSGDVAAWKKVVPADAPPQLEAQAKEMKKTPKEILEFLGSMSPDESTVTGLKVDGTKATLSITGKTKGEPKPSYGKVQMIQEGGAWKVGQQSWSDKPE